MNEKSPFNSSYIIFKIFIASGIFLKYDTNDNNIFLNVFLKFS